MHKQDDTELELAARLKSERKRVGMSAEGMADLGGVARATQFNYESGAAVPDVRYLLRLRPEGIDITYVLTGAREAAPTSLPEREQTLLTRYTSLPGSLKDVVDSVTLLAWLTFDSKRQHDYSEAISSPYSAQAAYAVHEPAPKPIHKRKPALR